MSFNSRTRAKLRTSSRQTVDRLESRVHFAATASIAGDLLSSKGHGGACGCGGCAALQKLADSSFPEITCGYDILMNNLRANAGGGNFEPSDRWFNTATNGNVGRRGTGLTLTYSFIPDGSSLPTGNGEPATPNDLFAKFNLAYGSPAVWQPLVRNAVELWGVNSGVTLTFEPNDDGAGPFTSGRLGVRGDIRIGGHRINGNGGVLASIANFSAVPHLDYRVGLPFAGEWEEVLNTDAEVYGGSGVGNLGVVTAEDVGWQSRPASASISVPPLGAVWLRYRG